MIMKNRYDRKAGFTLIEVLVVAVIIGILVAIGVVAYISAQRNARDAKRKSDLEAVKQALEMYRADNGSYPISGWAGFAGISIGLASYISPMPADPKTGTFDYQYRGTISEYCLSAHVENTGNISDSCGVTGSANDGFYLIKNP